MSHANARTNMFARRLIVERVAAGWPPAHVAEQPGSGAMDNAAYTRRHGPPTGKPRASADPVDHPRARADTERDKRSSKVTKGRSLRIWHSHADAAPECDPRYPGRSATSVTVSEPVNTRRPVSALASTTGWKAVERMKLGNHCEAYGFEHPPDANARG